MPVVPTVAPNFVGNKAQLPAQLWAAAVQTKVFADKASAKRVCDELARCRLGDFIALLEQLMKVRGPLQPDGASTTMIDARKQVVRVLGKRTDDELRALVAAGTIDAKPVLVDVTDNRVKLPGFRG